MGFYEITELLKDLVGQELILSWAKVIFIITCTSLVLLELGIAFGISMFFINLGYLIERKKLQQPKEDNSILKWWDKIRKAMASK